MTAKQAIKVLEKDGWFLVRQKGSHRIYRHPTKPGTVVVPAHAGDLKIGTERSILKQAGLL